MLLRRTGSGFDVSPAFTNEPSPLLMNTSCYHRGSIVSVLLLPALLLIFGSCTDQQEQKVEKTVQDVQSELNVFKQDVQSSSLLH